MENGILVEYKYQEISDDSPIEKRRKWMPQNVAEYFFFDEFGFLNINDRKITECYTQFIETLKFVFENLKNIYVKFSNKVITDEDLAKIDFPRIPKSF